MKVKAFNIEYDTDGLDVELPNELILDLEDDLEDDLDEDELFEVLSDKIADETEYLVNSFNYEIL